MSVDALYVRAYLMDSDVGEEDKITALVTVLQSMDSGKAFPQLLLDALINARSLSEWIIRSTVLTASRDLPPSKCFHTKFLDQLLAMAIKRLRKPSWKT